MRLSQYRSHLASDQALARRKASHPKLAPSHHTTPHLDQYRVPAVAAAPPDLIPPTTPRRLQLSRIPVWRQGRCGSMLPAPLTLCPPARNSHRLEPTPFASCHPAPRHMRLRATAVTVRAARGRSSHPTRSRRPDPASTSSSVITVRRQGRRTPSLAAHRRSTSPTTTSSLASWTKTRTPCPVLPTGHPALALGAQQSFIRHTPPRTTLLT
jgi:hypothetical protein